MSAHSPAPWKFVPPGGTNKYCDEGEDQGGFYDANGDRVCWFGDGSTYYPSDGEAPGEVDANLIAAAPDMVELIERWTHDGCLQTFEDRERFRTEALSLLSKATGAA